MRRTMSLWIELIPMNQTDLFWWIAIHRKLRFAIKTIVIQVVWVSKHFNRTVCHFTKALPESFDLATITNRLSIRASFWAINWTRIVQLILQGFGSKVLNLKNLNSLFFRSSTLNDLVASFEVLWSLSTSELFVWTYVRSQFRRISVLWWPMPYPGIFFLLRVSSFKEKAGLHVPTCPASLSLFSLLEIH